MFSALQEKLTSLCGKEFSSQTVSYADNFSYTDPVDDSLSSNQGVRILFESDARIVLRLSGTGTSGATLRVYLDRYEDAGGELDLNPQQALGNLIDVAGQIAEIEEFTGRTKPDVIT